MFPVTGRKFFILLSDACFCFHKTMIETGILSFIFVRMIMKIRVGCVMLLLLFVLHGGKLAAQELKDDSVLRIYGNAANVKADSVVRLIKIKTGLKQFFKRHYQQKIIRQISDDWFIVKNNAQLLSDTSVMVAQYNAGYNWKLSPAMLRVYKSLPPKRLFTFLLQTSDSAFYTMPVFQKAGCKIVSKDELTKTIQLTASLSFVTHNLIDDPRIIFIDIKMPPKEEMVINDYDNSVNAINLLAATYPDVTGAGLSVSVKENLFDTTDIDFAGRYLPTANSSASITTHATTMATLIGGGGNSFRTGKGVAPGSRLSSSDFANLLPDSDSSYAQYHTSVQNHSYGTSVENFYGADAVAFDQSLIAHPNLVYVFSAGNSGTLAASDGQYKNTTGFANLTGSFKQAKNGITVGSVDSFYRIPAASSKGPAYDGRIKPELVAYGNDGSSGAAAITSGTALAIQSAYGKLHHDSLPASALVKAVLVNSADDIFNEGPDYYSGYGNVNAYKAVQTINSGTYFSGNAQQNSVDSFVISIPDRIKNIKITLVWNDAPALANAYTALVNDLDLSVKKRGSNGLWLPWVLNSEPDSTTLLLPPQRRRDSLNVVEQITLSKPEKGDYEIYIKGYNVAAALQPYSVVFETDTTNTFQFSSPSADDHVAAGEKGIIRWRNTYENETGRLQYSTDKGASWQLIHDAVSVTQNYYAWQTPDTSVVALMRMTIGSQTYTSDTFDFSKRLLPQVVINCSDSVIVKWNALAGIHRYQIFLLGNKYLQDYATTTDTSIVITNSTSSYIAVAPVFATGRTGIKSYAFNYKTQGAGCYINNFLADLTVDDKADLQVTLGTLSGVDSVQYQQLIHNVWETLSVARSITDNRVEYVYDSLLNGINIFRAVVWVNGSQIISHTAAITYFIGTDFIAKPNPLPQGQNLSVLSSTLVTGALVIYDVWGRKLLQQEITNANNIIRTNTLSKGVYFIIIYDNKQEVYKGKLIVE